MTEQEKKEYSNYLINNIPNSIYRVFSAKVKLNGKTIREVLISFMENYGKYMNNYEENYDEKE